jgi:hypothetical protein
MTARVHSRGRRRAEPQECFPSHLLDPIDRLAETIYSASNIVSFAVLFYASYEWGKYTNASPWKTELILVGVGLLLLALAIPLGG